MCAAKGDSAKSIRTIFFRTIVIVWQLVLWVGEWLVTAWLAVDLKPSTSTWRLDLFGLLLQMSAGSLYRFWMQGCQTGLYNIPKSGKCTKCTKIHQFGHANWPSGNPTFSYMPVYWIQFPWVCHRFTRMHVPWDRCYDFKNIFEKKLAKILAFFAQTATTFNKHLIIIELGFWEKRQFFHRKLAKVARNCDHNIDPWLRLSNIAVQVGQRLPNACRYLECWQFIIDRFLQKVYLQRATSKEIAIIGVATYLQSLEAGILERLFSDHFHVIASKYFLIG
jgi:hypothetical protein